MKNILLFCLMLLAIPAVYVISAPENQEHVYILNSNVSTRVWTNQFENVSLAGVMWDIRSSVANTLTVSVVNYYTASAAATCVVYSVTNSPGGSNYTTFPARAIRVPNGDRVSVGLASATNSIVILNNMRE